MNTEISISLVGLAEKEKTVMTVALRLLGAYDIQPVVTDGSDGQLVIVDGASAQGQQYLSSQRPDQLCIVISDEDSGDSGRQLYVKRPIMVQTIKDHLVDMIERMKSSTVVTAAPPKAPVAPAAKTATQPAQTTSPADTGASTLFYSVLQAVEQKQMLRIDCKDHPAVFVHGPTRYLYSQAKPEEVCAMAKLPGEQLKTQVLDEGSFMQGAKGIKGRQLSGLLWSMMALGGKGRSLPENIANQSVRLKLWPRFRPDYVQTDCLNVAVHLLKYGLTPQLAAQKSGVDMAVVNDFFRIAHLLNMVEVEAASTAATPVQAAESKGLLGKIMRHLARRKG